MVDALKEDEYDAILQAYLKYDLGEKITEDEYDEMADDFCDEYSPELSFCAMDDMYMRFDEVEGYLNISDFIAEPCSPETPLGVSVKDEKRKRNGVHREVRIEKNRPKNNTKTRGNRA